MRNSTRSRFKRVKESPSGIVTISKNRNKIDMVPKKTSTVEILTMITDSHSLEHLFVLCFQGDRPLGRKENPQVCCSEDFCTTTPCSFLMWRTRLSSTVYFFPQFSYGHGHDGPPT